MDDTQKLESLDSTRDKEEGEEKEEELAVYELGFHLFPTLSEEAVTSVVSSLKVHIESAGGSIISDEFPKQGRLAYAIDGVHAGAKETCVTAFFGWIKFELGVGSLLKLKEVVTGDENILRFILIRTVRESTLVPKKLLMRTESPVARPAEKIIPRREEKPVVKLSEEEIEKTVEELMVE